MNKGQWIGYRYWVVVWLCLSSVSVAFANPANPHKLRNNKQACDLCHNSPDFNKPKKLCFSCHLCTQAEEESYCLDCHEYHGSAKVVKLLRKSWVGAEMLRSYKTPHNRGGNCFVCHLRRPKDKTELFLDFAGDINLLCRECHIQIICRHPVGIAVPDYMKKPEGLVLDKKKRIICTTCHSPNCKNNGAIYINGFSRKKGLQSNELCYRCHKPLAKNPHKNAGRRRNCLTCHTYMQEQNENDIDYTFLTNPRMVCLRCHPERPHPAGDDHRQVFLFKKKPVKKILKFNSFGRITCSTCHNPHVNPRFLCGTNANCKDCHKDYF